MPMTFTDEMVKQRADYYGVDPQSPNLRKIVANATIAKFGDVVEGWEILTGRPWTEMTAAEARKLIEEYPAAARNPGVLSRMMT